MNDSTIADESQGASAVADDDVRLGAFMVYKSVWDIRSNTHLLATCTSRLADVKTRPKRARADTDQPSCSKKDQLTLLAEITSNVTGWLIEQVVECSFTKVDLVWSGVPARHGIPIVSAKITD